VELKWNKPQGHTGAGKYVVVRDGATIATVPGSRTSYLDEGLRPGQSYSYHVIAQSWLRKSEPTADERIRVQAPSPATPTKGTVTTNTAVVHWAAPLNSPAPDNYEIMRDGSFVTSVDNKTMEYKDTGLAPATAYDYQVVAKWGANRSDPSASISVKTVTPPVADARLAGSAVSVSFKITTVNGITNLSRGRTWTASWDFIPRCSTGPCQVAVSGDFAPPLFRGGSFHTLLTRRPGGTYVATFTAKGATECVGVDVTDTLTLSLTVRAGGVKGNQWVATKWTGLLTQTSPFTDAGAFFCPATRMDTTLSGTAG
jgi:hypothetical protein